MKQIITICLALTMVFVGCKKVEVDFSFSPSEPRAGQLVKFNNKSSAGEDWAWDFGDKSYSVLKNPSHTFKKPGTYLVTLMVDSAKHNVCTHSITVYDTVPTFTTSVDSICHYTDFTLEANIYNPFSYELDYQWTLPEGCELVSGTLDGRAIVVHFVDFSKSATDTKEVSLSITQNGKLYHIAREFYVHETKAPAIIMQLNNDAILRQRMINGYLEAPITADAEDLHLLSISSDTIVNFNGVDFFASQMQTIFPGIAVDRIQIDPMAQKWYITSPLDGLFVTNFDGQNKVLIDSEATGAIWVDVQRNRIYWASTSGLKAMPLVKSKNNQFATTPNLYNTISDIDRIVVNNNFR
jgi:PKD repeat protein